MALNGGIRWLALNGEAVNGRGDMRGQRHSRGILFWGGDFRGRENFGERERLYGKTAFSSLRLEEFVGLLQGIIGFREFGLGGQ